MIDSWENCILTTTEFAICCVFTWVVIIHSRATFGNTVWERRESSCFVLDLKLSFRSGAVCTLLRRYILSTCLAFVSPTASALDESSKTRQTEDRCRCNDPLKLFWRFVQIVCLGCPRLTLVFGWRGGCNIWHVPQTIGSVCISDIFVATLKGSLLTVSSLPNRK